MGSAGPYFFRCSRNAEEPSALGGEPVTVEKMSGAHVFQLIAAVRGHVDRGRGAHATPWLTLRFAPGKTISHHA